jgi:hypothetical protein
MFSLPNSNYLDWKKENKQFLLKMVVAPWVLIFCLFIMNFVINPDSKTNAKKPGTDNPWEMSDYEIEGRDGLK